MVSDDHAAQALVEFALVLPVLMLMMLGFAELAFVIAERQGFQNGADVMAQWAASEMAEKPDAEDWHAGWAAIVKDETERTGCISHGPVVAFPDDTRHPGDRVLVTWLCAYSPKLTGIWFVLPITVQSEAVVPGVLAPSPSPS